MSYMWEILQGGAGPDEAPPTQAEPKVPLIAFQDGYVCSLCCCFVGQGFGVRVSLIEGIGTDLAPPPVLYQKYNYPDLYSARFGSKKCFP